MRPCYLTIQSTSNKENNRTRQFNSDGIKLSFTTDRPALCRLLIATLLVSLQRATILLYLLIIGISFSYLRCKINRLSDFPGLYISHTKPTLRLNCGCRLSIHHHVTLDISSGNLNNFQPKIADYSDLYLGDIGKALRSARYFR